jgi:hypothetical protein
MYDETTYWIDVRECSVSCTAYWDKEEQQIVYLHMYLRLNLSFKPWAVHTVHGFL